MKLIDLYKKYGKINLWYTKGLYFVFTDGNLFGVGDSVIDAVNSLGSCLKNDI